MPGDQRLIDQRLITGYGPVTDPRAWNRTTSPILTALGDTIDSINQIQLISMRARMVYSKRGIGKIIRL